MRIGREMALNSFNIERSEQAFVAFYSPVKTGKGLTVIALL